MCEILDYSILICHLSNSIGFMEFWCAKRKWMQHSHHVLVFGVFRRVNMYNVPCVTFFFLKYWNMYQIKFNPYSTQFKMWHSIWISLDLEILISPKIVIWERLFRLVISPNFQQIYIQNYSEIKTRNLETIFLSLSSY